MKLLLEDDTYINQKLNDPYYYDPNVIKDVRDGECFRRSVFFNQHPEAVPLIVFIDELEVGFVIKIFFLNFLLLFQYDMGIGIRKLHKKFQDLI